MAGSETTAPDLATQEAPGPSGRRDRRSGIVGPFTARQLLAILLVVVIAGMVLYALTRPLGRRGTTTMGNSIGFYQIGEAVEGLQAGQRAPELQGEVDGQVVGLVDLDGRPIRLADLRGRPVWINFWATWCPPCQQETPVLRAMHERHAKDDLAHVAISVQESTPDDVRRYAQTYGLGYTIGFDATSAVFRAYRAYGLPTQLFIDREGIIRGVWHGPLTEQQAEELLAPILASPEPSPSVRPTPTPS
jgi:cytochrome c biogenesis protein CcmG/thiol:disulfide interchange protein DsbE